MEAPKPKVQLEVRQSAVGGVVELVRTETTTEVERGKEARQAPQTASSVADALEQQAQVGRMLRSWTSWARLMVGPGSQPPVRRELLARRGKGAAEVVHALPAEVVGGAADVVAEAELVGLAVEEVSLSWFSHQRWRSMVSS